ncbi:MAG: type II toxin-antitoxin system death-on-curing family toxin [Thermomicrobiales bacterium]
MTRPAEYLTVADIIEAHAQIMESMGLTPQPLRSLDLLESAAMKPQAAAYYANADIAEQAALLATGISQNQPFLDGNKRTAYAAMRVFLTINHVRIDAPVLEIARQLEAVAEREGSLEAATLQFAAWLRERTVPRE